MRKESPENHSNGALGRAIDTAQCSITGQPDSMWRHNEFFEHLRHIFNDCHAIAVQKNTDYTRISSDDPFHNFKDTEIDIALRKASVPVDSAVLNLLYRIGEKRKRLVNVIMTGEINVLSESLEDTLNDLINYHAILLAYLKMNGRLEYKEDLKSINQEIIKDNQYLRDELTKKDMRIKEFLEIENNHLKKNKSKK